MSDSCFLNIIGEPCAHLLNLIQQAGMQSITDAPNMETDGYILLEAPKEDDHLLKREHKKGKPILGIGSGAKWLVETGIIPGIEGDKSVVQIKTLQEVVRQSVHLVPSIGFQYNAFTRFLSPQTIWVLDALPIYSYFSIPPMLLAEMIENGLVIFKDEELGYPLIIANKAGNAMAAIQPIYLAKNGLDIFKSIQAYIKKGYKQRVVPLHYYPR